MEKLNALKMGERIRKCRIAKQQTMKEFAEQCGISERYLADIERGYKIPRTETLLMMVNQLGTSMDFILQDSLKLEEDPFRQLKNAVISLNPKQQLIISQFIIALANANEK